MSRVCCTISYEVLILTMHSPDIVVSCDTNFTQKRCKDQYDRHNALLIYSNMIFILEEKVKIMKTYIEQLRIRD